MFRWVLIAVAAFARILRGFSPAPVRAFDELAQRQQDDLWDDKPDTRTQMEQYTR